MPCRVSALEMVGLLVWDICNPHRSVPQRKTFETVRRTVKETSFFPRANAVRGKERCRGGGVVVAVHERRHKQNLQDEWCIAGIGMENFAP